MPRHLSTYPVPEQPPSSTAALAWLRKRGPPIPESLRHRLFRERVIRVYHPAEDRVARVRPDAPLPPGARVLVPKAQVAARTPDAPLPPHLRGGLRRLLLLAHPAFIALNKPPGLAVQGDEDWSLAKLIRRPEAWEGGAGPVPFDPEELRLVHRLDQPTSGVLLVARGPDNAAWLGQGMAAAARGIAGVSSGDLVSIRKRYWAAAEWDPSGSPGQYSAISERAAQALLTRASPRFQRLAQDVLRGDERKKGVTLLRTLRPAAAPGAPALLEAELVTGRRHQLRQLLAWGLRAPILGDRVYGPRTPANRGPLFLHCHWAQVSLPGAPGEVVTISAPPPRYWTTLARGQGWHAILQGAEPHALES